MNFEINFQCETYIVTYTVFEIQLDIGRNLPISAPDRKVCTVYVALSFCSWRRRETEAAATVDGDNDVCVCVCVCVSVSVCVDVS